MGSLSRIPTEPPSIAPVRKGSDVSKCPLWSVMIPAYNCANFLPETLKSVLQQDPGENKMQIEVCDDASADADIKQIVADIGKGRIDYFRQPENTGSLRNFETCINRSRGYLIHLLHGDDKVRTGFYEKMEDLFDQFSDIGAAFCRYVSVDEYDGTEMISDLEMPGAGILDNWLERLACKQRIQTPAVVVRRSVYEKLGSFYGVHYGEDWEMWMRIAANYPVGYIPGILAEYRKHDGSISGQSILTGQNIRDLKQVMNISKQYFADEQWGMIHKKAKEFYADYAINTARKIWGRYQHLAGTKAQINEALGLSVNSHILYQATKLYIKIFLGIKK